MVLTNKRYLIEGQGNFGNIFTGDPAAAPRYIECRLTELARNEMFNDEITEFVPSYDGRNKEPVTLALQAAADCSCSARKASRSACPARILPHNFPELLEAQIAILKKQPFKCLPDFQTGGLMDARDYQDGKGSVKVRAKIKVKDESTVVIKEIPPTTTTDSLIASIEDAARKGKLKVKASTISPRKKSRSRSKRRSGVERGETGRCALCLHRLRSDHRQPHRRHQGQSPGRTDGVRGAAREHRRNWSRCSSANWNCKEKKLQDELHFRTLERIFIEERIYKKIEQCKTQRSGGRRGLRRLQTVPQGNVSRPRGCGRGAAAAGAHPPHFAVRHQQASRGDGKGEGGPGRDAQEPEEPDQVRHRPSGSVAREIRPACIRA